MRGDWRRSADLERGRAPVTEERVTFFSGGEVVAGLLRRPETGRAATVVHAPGWMSLKDAAHYRNEHAHLTSRGMAVLIFDYRGFGDSGGQRGVFDPFGQVADLRAAVSYLRTRDDVDPGRIGVLGSGGTGGGVALFAAAVDERVACVVAMFPIADGRDWLESMRRPHEWHELQEALESNRLVMARGGPAPACRPWAAS